MRDTLIAARALIDTPDKWLKGHWARDADGGQVFPTNPDAVCYCLVGAIRACDGGTPVRSLVATVIEELFDSRFYQTTVFNDHPTTTHADVMRVLDTAIERAPA